MEHQQNNVHPPPASTPVPYNMNWFVRYRYQRDDPHNDARNVILIVSALIVTVTFQAGVNPPGGVWQDSSDGHIPGSAIYSSHKIPFYTFLIFNTLALSASILSILSLTFMFPFSFEIWIATASVIISYCSAIFAVTPHGDNYYKFRYVLVTAAVPLVVRVVVEFCRWVTRSSCKDFHPWKIFCCYNSNDPEARAIYYKEGSEG